MDSTAFYHLCIKKSVGAMFPEFDSACLGCERRIGSHGQGEFERCAENYSGSE